MDVDCQPLIVGLVESNGSLAPMLRCL